MPTIKDVAREAGVSIATVSYVLNGKTEAISPDTRQRVWAAAEKVGYRANVTARNLRSSRTRLIGYGWQDAPSERLVDALTRAAGAAGYHLLTFTFPPDDPLPVYEELIRTGRVDGLVIGDTASGDPRVRFLLDRSFPFVSIRRGRARANADWDFVWGERDERIREAVEYLVRACEAPR